MYLNFDPEKCKSLIDDLKKTYYAGGFKAGKSYKQFKQESECKTGGGINEWYYLTTDDFDNMQKQFKPKEKDWQPVLKLQDISVRHIVCKKCTPQDQLFISAPGFNSVQVPQYIIDEYETNQTELVYSHSMQRMVESFVSLNEYIIKRCINEAVIFHPCDELKFSIDINS